MGARNGRWNAGNGGTPPWARSIVSAIHLFVKEARQDRKQAVEDRKEAADDRKQAADDRKQAADDRKLMAHAIAAIGRQGRELRQGQDRLEASMARLADAQVRLGDALSGQSRLLERIVDGQGRMQKTLDEIARSLRVRSNGRGGNGNRPRG